MRYVSVGEQFTAQRTLLGGLDCSGALHGQREAWSLALLNQARQADRDFIGILFSSAHEVATLPLPRRTAR